MGKKLKASKNSFNPIILTQGDLHNIREMVRDVTTETLQQFVEEHQMVLGALRAQIKDLQVHTPQAGIVSTSLALGMDMTKEMLRTQMTNTIMLLEGLLVTENEANRPMVSRLKGNGINMVALPREMLYVLQDGVTV